MARIERSQGDLRKAFDDQLRFLEASCDAYDLGFEGEASRIALTLRILLLDRGASKSLLGQLGELNRHFISTASPEHQGNQLEINALVAFASHAERGWVPVAWLDGPHLTERPFPDWWSEVIFSNAQFGPMSRETLVRAVADQDGGAHVDPRLDEAYARAKLGEGLGLQFNPPLSARGPVASPTQAAVRQIGHEVLRTLRPDYRKEFNAEGFAIIVGSMSVSSGPAPGLLQKARAPKRPLVGRNKLCPCNSGKKYKRCCGSALT